MKTLKKSFSKRRYKMSNLETESMTWFKDYNILYRKTGPSVIWKNKSISDENLWIKGSAYFRIDGPCVVKHNEILWAVYDLKYKFKFCKEEYYWNF